MKNIVQFVFLTAIASGCFGFVVGLAFELACWLGGIESAIDWHIPRALGIAGLLLGPIAIYGWMNEKDSASR